MPYIWANNPVFTHRESQLEFGWTNILTSDFWKYSKLKYHWYWVSRTIPVWEGWCHILDFYKDSKLKHSTHPSRTTDRYVGMCRSCLMIALQQQQHRQLCAFLHGSKHFVQKRYSPILQFCQILLFYHNLGINPIWLYSIQNKFPKHLGIQGKIRLSLCSKGTHSLVVNH